MRKRQVVLVIEDVQPGTTIDGEVLRCRLSPRSLVVSVVRAHWIAVQIVGARQLEDLNRARAFLCDIASRQHHNCDVFPTVEKVRNRIARFVTCSQFCASASLTFAGCSPHCVHLSAPPQARSR